MSGWRVEVSPPKQGADRLEERLGRFARRFNTSCEAGFQVCITDNAMGKLAFQGCELLAELALPAARAMIHLNTFHTLAELRWILDSAAHLGVRELLVVSGDGSARLPRLKPADLGETGAVVTSVELLAFITREYPGVFNLGAAFNPYEPQGHELEKLKRKLAAGARFFITQPVIGRHPAVDALLEWLSVPLVVEAWMSPKLELLKDCVGYDPGAGATGPFDPLRCLSEIRTNYPGCGLYLALFDLKTQLPALVRDGGLAA
ncbi:MAG: methylenetetrahydrofolate reductase [Lentisphaeria bacterium]